MAAPLVSVVIPTHKRPELLRRALRSVADQTLQDLEVIVVENGGASGAAHVVREWTGRGAVRLLSLEEADPHLARNTGLVAATGRYCALLDDDDEWLPEKLERQVAAMEADPRLGWVACGGWRVNELEHATPIESPFYQGIPMLKALIVEWCFVWSLSCVLIRRTCFGRVGLFNPAYFIAGDYDLYVRLAREYPFQVLDERLFRYHQHAQNMTRQRDRVWRETLAVMRTVAPCPSQGVTSRTVREGIARYGRWYYGLAVEARDRRAFRDAARYFRAAVQCDPWIGDKIDWSRIKHPVYRALRPYVCAVECALRGLRQEPSP